MYRDFIKRLIDIILSACGIVILSPLFLFLIIAAKLEDPGPAFFRQTRVGLHKQNFTIVKFRSLKLSAPHDVPTAALPAEQYVTRVGRILRKTSLDELPQLFQILTGKMSIIGPRPVICAEQEVIDARDRYGANDVRPGLTGWAQINGRDELSAEEKARYDGEYVQHMSFRFDCRCFFGTIGKVLKCEGVIEGAEGGQNSDWEENM